jgi:hypothetical protein
MEVGRFLIVMMGAEYHTGTNVGDMKVMAHLRTVRGGGGGGDKKKGFFVVQGNRAGITG